MFRDLMTMQDRMTRLFDEVLPALRRQEEPFFGGNWAPAVDIYEDDQSLVLKADLPEIDPKDVEIRIEDNILFLKGDCKFEKEVKQENFHRVERAYGTFSRSFALPHTVATEKISAEYKNGVLKVVLPKREESKPKQIKVQVN